MRRRAYLASLSGGVAAAMAGCSGGTTNSQNDQDTIEMDMATWFTYMDAPQGPRFTWVPFKEKLEPKLTELGYDVNFDEKLGGSVGGVGELMPLAGDGVMSFGMDLPAYQGGQMPLNSYVGLPNLWEQGEENFDAAVRAMHDMTVGGESEALNEEFDQFNIRPIIHVSASAAQMVTNWDPFHNLDELADRAVRAAGGTKSLIAEQLNMSPTDVSGPDLYEAHDRGVVEADIINIPAVFEDQWFEVMNHMTTNINLGGFGISLFVGQDTFNGYPDEVQQAILDAARETNREFASNYYEMINTEIFGTDQVTRELPVDGDNEVYVYETDAVDAMNNAMEPVVDSWVDQQENNGRPGQQVLDTFDSLYQEHL